MAIDDKKEACKTYIEQTKLLVTLATTFIIAPAAARAYLHGTSTVVFVLSELALIFSVGAGYLVLGSIAGSQDAGTYDVYRKATMWLSWTQIVLFLVAIGLFIFFVTTGQHSGATTGKTPS